MPAAFAPSLGIVAYVALFAAIGVAFLFTNLLVGRFLRASNPHAEKSNVYECGEPSIGTSFVQFDLRFYVVALLFIVFEVEVGFFFPWATVFGKSTHLADQRLEVVTADPEGNIVLTKQAELLYRELGVQKPSVPDVERVPASLSAAVDAAGSNQERARQIIKLSARQLAWITIVDIVVFFAVLMVGFAYVWKRGDLDWVRSVVGQRSEDDATVPTGAAAEGRARST
jgi:NADH-quinone oxidoreductase subunit A